MILKQASFSFTDISPIQKQEGNKLIRTASSGRVLIEPGSDKEKIVQAEIKKHPNALFFRAKAIEADEPNSNGDYFSVEELLESYKSFEGVPFFTNHDNQNVENARGKVIFAEWVPEDKAVYTISFIDRDAYPHICRSIEEEYVTGVSMGCSVTYSVCNICGNTAESTDDYCDHIKNKKGRTFSGTARNVKTGEVKTFKNEPVFEFNHGLKFIELSAVVDPACPNCHIEGIIPNGDYLMKVANLENSFRMIKTAALEKQASQQEVDQIEQCLQTLEQIAINLIQNRKQVEMEFSSDLVEIMSSLQTWLDELVGAGYANMDGGVPGTVGDMPEEGMGDSPDMNGAPPAGGQPMGAMPAPVSEEMSTSVGDVSGSPSKANVSMPQIPITAPIKPRTSDIEDSRTIQRVSNKNINETLRTASNLVDKIKKLGEQDMAGRRTLSEKKANKEKAIEILSNSWEEKQDFFEYIKKMPSLQKEDCRLSINKRDDSFIIVAESKKDSGARQTWTYEDLTKQERESIIESPKDSAVQFLDVFASNLKNYKEGATQMTEINRKAGANSVSETPDQVQEKQLDRQDLYHARTNDETHDITQKQLSDSRYGEQEVTTEKQLESVRKNNTPSEVQEAQFTGDNRKGEDKHEITQKQLSNAGQRTEKEFDVVTEKQLSDISTPWARTAKRDSSLFKGASEHMDSVVDVMASATIKSGCTPDEICVVASTLVDSLQSRYNLGVSLMEEFKSQENIDYAKRVAYWQNKNLRVASAGNKEIAELIVDGLRAFASDETYSLDTLIDAVDIIAEGDVASEIISSKVEEKLAEANSAKTVRVSKKEELRQALKGKKSETTASTKDERDAERKQILASLDDKKIKAKAKSEKAEGEKINILNPEAAKDADTIIETSFGEIDCKKDDPEFKKEVKAFAKGALASQNMRLASITNVTISGDTIQIAVQTDTEENSVNIDAGEGTTEIPLGGGTDMEAPMGEEQVPEGDASGEGLGGAWASSKKKSLKRQAQSPMGGGMQQSPGGVTPGAPEQGLPGPTPENDPVQALTEGVTGEDEEGLEDIPSTGERQMPWTVCPECGSTDVDVSNENGDIHGACSSCGAEYEAIVKKEIEFKIIKPTKSIGEDGVEGVEAPEAPEVPALPVAAQTKLGKDALVRLASNREKHGHVCPSCGTKHCTASKEENGHSEFTCSNCGTDVEKDIMVSKANKSNGILRVSWNVFPEAETCKDCAKEAKKFASKLKAKKMLTTASKNSNEFPCESCMERLARKYGGNTVATFGPCKGKLLAECVCKELQKLGFKKVRHMNKLASASLAVDPWDECMEDQTKNKGQKLIEAETVCGCLKKRYASKDSDNIYVQAFADDISEGIEKDVSLEDLRSIQEVLEEEKVLLAKARKQKIIEAENQDIPSELPPAEFIEAEIEEEIITASKDDEDSDENEEEVVEASKDDSKESDNEDDSKESDNEDDSEDEDLKVEASIEDDFEIQEINEQEEKQIALAMNGRRVRKTNEEIVKMASKPTVVKDIEHDVEAGVPRAKATMKNEGKDNIDVDMASPSIPRGNAEMGQEGADNINPKADLPDVAVDSSYMGKEKEVQKNMPAINNEIKGTVLASIADDIATKIALAGGVSKESVMKLLRVEAKKLQEVDSVEGDVEAGVPRAKATIKNEGKDNIDVDMASPSVPRGNAEMGEEGVDNINPKADAPDVPVGGGHMGHEKEVQKDMPGINEKMLKNVEQKRQVQMDRIAQARQNEAIQTAAYLTSNNRIANDRETFDDVVEALKAFPTDEIRAKADRMFPMKKTAKKAVASNEGHSIPAIIQESKTTQEGDDLQNRLASAFTIGNSHFDQNLTIYGEK
jgi:Zn ribbon nucleic-acid-binding protein